MPILTQISQNIFSHFPVSISLHCVPRIRILKQMNQIIFLDLNFFEICLQIVTEFCLKIAGCNGVCAVYGIKNSRIAWVYHLVHVGLWLSKLSGDIRVIAVYEHSY